MRPIAPKAFLRPCQSRARSAAVSAVRTLRALMRAKQGLDHGVLGGDAFGLAVELHQQHRGGIGGIPRRIDGRFDRLDAGLVHHLERGGHDAGGDDGGDGLAGGADAREVGEQRAHSRRNRLEPHGDAAGDAEHSLTADEEADEVGSPGVAVRRAEPGERTVGQDDLQVGDVIGGDAGLEAVRPAGVLGDVAPDGAGGLARGIGDVLQAEGAAPPRRDAR